MIYSERVLGNARFIILFRNTSKEVEYSILVHKLVNHESSATENTRCI